MLVDPEVNKPWAIFLARRYGTGKCTCGHWIDDHGADTQGCRVKMENDSRCPCNFRLEDEADKAYKIVVPAEEQIQAKLAFYKWYWIRNGTIENPELTPEEWVEKERIESYEGQEF